MIMHKRRFQGIIAVCILFVAMLGGLMHDPFVKARDISRPENKASILKRIKTEFKTRRNYAGVAPFLRNFIFYKMNSSGNKRVFIGSNKHLYYNDENVIPQSTGEIYREDQILHFVDIASTLSRELAARGARLIVTSPPNAQSVAIRDFIWYRQKGPLEYDLAMKELSVRGIETVDLKAYFRSFTVPDEFYRHTDTHWTGRAAILAFNQIVARVGNADWQMDPNSILTPAISGPAGDLASFLKLQSYITETTATITAGPEQKWLAIDVFRTNTFGPFDFYAYQHRQIGKGERILIIGDSFSQSFWKPLLLRTSAERIGWMHFNSCNFDFINITQFEPTLVILAPTERYIPCPEDHWPADMQRP